MIDLIGQKFGRLEVVARAHNDALGHVRWLCKCSCGKESTVMSFSLKNGRTKSCGCLIQEIKTKHGHKKDGKITGIYKSWFCMKQRCNNPHNKDYPSYGGRGIAVCKEWLEFSNFLKDMGEQPPNQTIERIDNDKGYCKSNCCWATRTRQARNKSNTRFIRHGGIRQSIDNWSEETGIPKAVIRSRLARGWSIEKTLTTAAKKYKKREKIR